MQLSATPSRTRTACPACSSSMSPLRPSDRIFLARAHCHRVFAQKIIETAIRWGERPRGGFNTAARVRRLGDATGETEIA